MLVLLLFFNLITIIISIRHSLCTVPSLTVRTMDVVAASKGAVLIAVFMPLQCASCYRQLKRLSYMSSNLADVRVVVVAPSYEAPVTITRTQSEFPRLIVDRDINNIWRIYNASNHDKIIFDRCGRVTQVLSHPRSDMTSYRDTLDAIDRARRGSPCGPCDYTMHDRYRYRQKQTKGIDAFFQRRRDINPIRHLNRQDVNFMSSYNNNNNNADNDQITSDAKRYVRKQTQNDTVKKHDILRYYVTTTISPSWKREFNVNLRQPSFRRTSNVIYGVQYENNHHGATNDDAPQHKYRVYQKLVTLPRTTTSTTSQPLLEKTYGPDEDYEDDLLPLVKTTPPLQTQIPKPTMFDPLWPTPAPGQFFISDPRNPLRDDTSFTSYGEQASENNIPCSAYTDDICYQQQEKFGREGLSKCCKKGIYLTDVCVPGKCSNHTVQLCCFQKFLQARFRCCDDDKQAIGPASTNDFSKCCYSYFVNEDSCCNDKTASHYWKSIHELCYPNTKVDYSGIKMEVRFNEGVRVVDLNEKRVWDYECQNGVNRTQYAYLP